MPVNDVKTAEDEIAWDRAKARAREQYPNVTGERFYRIVLNIFKTMVHDHGYLSPSGEKEAAARRMR